MQKRPSYVAMLELSGKNDPIKAQLVRERQAAAAEEFNEDLNWTKNLDVGKNGQFRQTTDNVVIIMEHDPALAAQIRQNDFLQQVEATAPLPWRQNPGPWEDTDDASLRHYLERIYGIDHVGKISDALTIVADRIHFHPVREYLNRLEWDGLPRVETLLIDYLNASDTPYTRAVTRKFLAAAVARVFTPGIKYDYMLTLIGPQGIGKSELVKRLARNWHSDSFSTVQGKEAYEQLQGVWIIEMAELTATKKAEVEAVKHFISKREDIYRVAYGRRVSHFPRQCVFVGTTNDPECLKDKTGNRRFLTVDCHSGEGKA